MTQRHLSKLHLILAGHQAHLRTRRLEQNCAGWKHERHNVERKFEVHVSVSSRQQFAGRIRNIGSTVSVRELASIASVVRVTVAAK